MSVSGHRLEEAYHFMIAAKARGDWDASKGDVPQRLGPLPIPPGYLTLSEVCDSWVTEHLAGIPNADDDIRIKLADDSIAALMTLLINGSLQAYAVSKGPAVNRVPSTLWLHLSEDPGGTQNIMLTIDRDCMTGAAFEPHYAGCTAVVREEAFTAITATRLPKVRDQTRPWRDFSSVSAWLSSRQATAFIDSLLHEQGDLAPRPIDRDRALHKYLVEHGEAIEFTSLQGRRRPSRMTD